MRDTISIIFASIFMVLVIVILPLFSILDRQDNIAYNVVLTQTSKFVDEIRANGFITENQYEAFVSSLASTGNTYKVTLEAYKHTLIPATNAAGNVIKDTFVDELELYNTKDIVDYLTNKAVNEEVDDSNRKQNIYLFEKSDEIYVRVYNTNITAGSVMYNMLMGAVNTKVIDVKYGGVVNNVNWELYNKMKVDTIATPKVILSVPVNAENSINVIEDETGPIAGEFMSNDQLRDIECIIEDYGALFATPKEMCEDIDPDLVYKYRYDLQEEKNKKITIAVKFEDVDEVQVRFPNLIDYIYDIFSYDSWSYIKSNELFDKDATNIANRSSAEQFVIDNYIVLSGIEADINLTTKNNVGTKHDFNIELTNVKIATIDALTEIASVSVLPGLGRNIYHDLTIGDETIKFEVTTKTEEEELAILGPYNWKQLLKTKVIAASAIATDPLIVFRNQEIFFRIQFTGFAKKPEEMVTIISNKLKVIRESVEKTVENGSVSLAYFTPKQMKDDYGVTIDGDSILVRLKYTNSHALEGNRYLYLDEKWIDEMPEKYSQEIFYLDRDTYSPNAPRLLLDGLEGNNGWYISDVGISVSRLSDPGQSPGVSRTTSEGVPVASVASGIWRTTVEMSGAQTLGPADLDDAANITVNGETLVKLKTEDYAGNAYTFPNKTVKIDKENPSTPALTIPTAPASGWYTSNVTIKVAAGTDNHSGFDKTTYLIEGANATGSEKTYTGTITLTESGISRVTIKNYDVAGNVSIVTREIKIDKGEPPVVTFENISGLKKNEDTEWYHTSVETRITVHYTGSLTQSPSSHYEVSGPNPVEKTEFSGDIYDIVLQGNGIHTIKVYTSTTTGETDVYEHVVKIDEDAPKTPIITLTGTKEKFKLPNEAGEIEEEEASWFSSDVVATITLDEDVGDSGIENFTYTTQFNEEEPVEFKDMPSGTTITFDKDGTTLLTIIATDKAGNEEVYQEYIRIDKTKPTAATAVINAVPGKNDWYTSSAYISHENEGDDVSGISYVTIEIQKKDASGEWVHESYDVWDIAEDTDGKKIILTTYNGAALAETTETIIKIDTQEPTAPSISLSTAGSVGFTESSIYMTNGAVTGTITAGVDQLKDGVKSDVWKTTYEISLDGGDHQAETEGTSVTVAGTNEADQYYSIIARTYDNAGNYAEETATFRINQRTPDAPEIVAVNGVSVEGGVAIGEPGAGSITVAGAIGTELKVYVAGSNTNTVTYATDTEITDVSCGCSFSDGVSYSIYVTLKDRFGKTSSASATVTYQCRIGGEYD